jgi:molybdopterin synthase catalytic subunit
MISVVIQESDFDIGAESKKLASLTNLVGAISTFTGYVRNLNDDESVSSLFLEHYPGMTENQISEIINIAAKQWQILGATVIHRVGNLEPGEQIVFVAVASQHRGDAFDACEYIIDFLKTKAAFWKREDIPDGSRWLETRESDIDTAAKWESK